MKRQQICAFIAAAGLFLTAAPLTPAMAQTTTQSTTPHTTATAPSTAASTSAQPSTSVPSTAPTVSLPSAPLPAPNLDAVPDYSDRFSADCAIDTNDDLWCWGENNRGQLGNGTTTPSTKPVKVPNFKAKAITTHMRGNRCAIDTNGKPWCWGPEATYPDFQNKPTAVRDFPAEVKLEKISVGSGTGCGIATDQSVWCWGENSLGEFGNGTITEDATQTKPSKIPNFKAKTISMLTNAGCAITPDNKAYCWGNFSGGDRTGNYEDRYRPVSMGNFKAIDISGHSDAVCALEANGTPRCWGDIYSGTVLGGPLGRNGEVINSGVVATKLDARFNTCIVDHKGTPWCWGNTFGPRVGNTPQRGLDIPANYGNREVTNAVDITNDADNVYYVDSSGQLWGWGLNKDGNLGVGNTDPQPSPVKIPGIKIF